MSWVDQGDRLRADASKGEVFDQEKKPGFAYYTFPSGRCIDRHFEESVVLKSNPSHLRGPHLHFQQPSAPAPSPQGAQSPFAEYIAFVRDWWRLLLGGYCGLTGLGMVASAAWPLNGLHIFGFASVAVGAGFLLWEVFHGE